MSYIMVDVETDGPIPGKYSMISFGAAIVQPELSNTFYGQLKPISENWIPEALKISGCSRKETLTYEKPEIVMRNFSQWISETSTGKPIFISDNNGFDWQFINWYFHTFTGSNPFGYSSVNLGSLYRGLMKDMEASFKHLRKTKHTHNPLDDAIGNAEALLALKEKFGVKIQF